MDEDFTVSAEATKRVFIDAGSVFTRTDGVATVIAAETVGTDVETVMIGDVTIGAVTGGEREVTGTVEGLVWVKGGPAWIVWRRAAWWRAALRRFFSLCAGPRWRGRWRGDGSGGGEG